MTETTNEAGAHGKNRSVLSRRAALGTMFGGLASSAVAQTARKPNLIVILADDLGYGDLGCYGSADVPTPNIDALARSGIRFTNGYVTNAVCSPSRAALLTGRYQHRFGHEYNIGPAPREFSEKLGLPLTEMTIPQMLKKGGYATAAFGKWHLGAVPEFHPMERGFDEFFGFLHGQNNYVVKSSEAWSSVGDGDGDEPAGARVGETRKAPIFRGRSVVEEKEYLTDAFGREAVSFIGRHSKDPFFMYLAFNAVHEPLQATQRYLDRFANITNKRHRMLAAMTSALDENVGKVVAKVREAGIERDTMIVFLSDNGCPTYTQAGSNGPLNGSKVTFYEGGIRIPFAARWPGRIPDNKVDNRVVSSLDILPTFLELAGVATPTDREFDGVSLVPLLTGKSTSPVHDVLFWRSGKNSAVRKGNWKLVQVGDSPRLYDLASDLGEKTNLAAQKPEVVKELQAAWNGWSTKTIAPRWTSHGSSKIPINGEVISWEV